MRTALSQQSALRPVARRWLTVVLALSIVTLASTVLVGLLLERAEHTPLVRVGQPAPGFTLKASQGGMVSLADQRGHPVLLAFVPSVQCSACQDQLRSLEAALPELSSRQVAVFAISTDEPEVQETIARKLHLTYPFVAEDVVVDRHPAGHAYGVYHLSGSQQGPIDANALFLVDAGGTVRVVDVRPAGQLAAAELLLMVSEALAQSGSAP